jgi:hypothetical protein
MKSISVQYQELKEGKMNKNQFLRNARMMFPSFVTNHNSFDDSVKILKNKGLLNEGDAVKGTPDKAPIYDYPTQPGKYKKVVQEPEVDEQDGIYPATTLTDIPKEEVSKPIKSKNRPDGLEPIKDKDKKNEMKKIRLVRESKKNLTENQVTAKQIQDKYNEMFGKNPQTTFADIAKALGVSEQEIASALFFKGNMPGLRKNDEDAKIEAMIAKAKEEESGKYTKFDDYEDGLSESDKKEVVKKAVEKLSKEELKALWNAWEKRGEKTFAGILPVGSSIDMEQQKKKQQMKEAIKNFIHKTIDEIGPGGIEAAGNPEEEKGMRDVVIKKEYEMGDESDNIPSIMAAINRVVEDMKNSIESNDLDLKWTMNDLIDIFASFENRTGRRYSDEEFNKIIDGAVDKLKKQGYNLTK